MTVQEAKKVIEDFDKCVTVKADGCYETIDYIKAKEIAIEGMEEVEQYRALGTVEEIEPYIRLAEKLNICDLVSENKRLSNKIQFLEIELKEAREKQVPKKPIHDDGVWSICPCCGEKVANDSYEAVNGELSYCEKCGQALDWEEGGASD